MRTVSQAKLGPPPSQTLKRPGTAPAKAPQVDVKVEAAPAPIINIDMSKFSDNNTAALKMLADALKTQQPSPAAESPKEWEFTVIRDGNNLIKTITAKCK